MRNKKIALLALATITSTNLLIAQPAFAFSQNKVTVNAEDSYNESDWYAENKIETVNIENTQYTYLYHYENGNKTITITNNLNDTIEKIMIDQSSNMYLNNNFNIEVGKKIITCYVIASTIIPLIYSRIKK